MRSSCASTRVLMSPTSFPARWSVLFNQMIHVDRTADSFVQAEHLRILICLQPEDLWIITLFSLLVFPERLCPNTIEFRLICPEKVCPNILICEPNTWWYPTLITSIQVGACQLVTNLVASATKSVSFICHIKLFLVDAWTLFGASFFSGQPLETDGDPWGQLAFAIVDCCKFCKTRWCWSFRLWLVSVLGLLFMGKDLMLVESPTPPPTPFHIWLTECVALEFSYVKWKWKTFLHGMFCQWGKTYVQQKEQKQKETIVVRAF